MDAASAFQETQTLPPSLVAAGRASSPPTLGGLALFFCVQKFVGELVEVVAPVHGAAARVIGSGSTEETAMEYHAPEDPASTICGAGGFVALDLGARIVV